MSDTTEARSIILPSHMDGFTGTGGTAKLPQSAATMPFCPEELLRPLGKGLIVRTTIQYHASKAGSIFLPDDSRFEKKFKLGEVIAIGPNVDRSQLDVGDILVYQEAAAFRLPNGPNSPHIWKVEFSDALSCIAVLPNLDPSKVSPHWKVKPTHLGEVVVRNSTFGVEPITIDGAIELIRDEARAEARGKMEKLLEEESKILSEREAGKAKAA